MSLECPAAGGERAKAHSISFSMNVKKGREEEKNHEEESIGNFIMCSDDSNVTDSLWRQ